MRLMISHFHTQAKNNKNPKDDHNLLAISQNVPLVTQLQNRIYSHNITNKRDVLRIPFEVRIPWITKPFHFAL
jgi:hypothetical protein